MGGILFKGFLNASGSRPISRSPLDEIEDQGGGGGVWGGLEGGAPQTASFYLNDLVTGGCDGVFQNIVRDIIRDRYDGGSFFMVYVGG